ncbi:MAG: hypothetical protein JOY91_17990 [Sinobacteraceae bacterium]|nr:hypothetical protein [Nevskiaceae bacterium]
MNYAYVDDFGPPITIRVIDCLLCESPVKDADYHLLKMGRASRLRYALCPACRHQVDRLDAAAVAAIRRQALSRLHLISNEMRGALHAAHRLN